MTFIKPLILTCKVDKILSILKNIIKDEGVVKPIINYPVLIGSRAAKWHVPSFREPNDWDLIATPSQSTSFINKTMSFATFKDIKSIYYPDVGLKIVGSCIEHKDGNPISFDIELVSNKVDLRKMKVHKVESYSYMDVNKINNDDKFDRDDVEFKEFYDHQQKTSGQMILELCRDVKDKTLFPLSSFPCIVAPLKLLEALKSSHIYWPNDFNKNIADLHSLRVLAGYNEETITRQQ